MFPSTISARLGESVKFYCSHSFRIKWFFQDDTLPSGVKFSWTTNISILIIPSLDYRHIGTYKCVYDNQANHFKLYDTGVLNLAKTDKDVYQFSQDSMGIGEIMRMLHHSYAVLASNTSKIVYVVPVIKFSLNYLLVITMFIIFPKSLPVTSSNTHSIHYQNKCFIKD